MNKPNLIIWALILIMTPLGTYADNHTESEKPEESRNENIEWKRIIYIKYQPTRANRARSIINNYYKPASEKAGTNQPYEMELDMRSGEWDVIRIQHFRNGVQDLAPRNRSGNGGNQGAWRKALNEIAGSEEEAQAIMDEYRSLIKEQVTEIAIVRN